MATPSPTLKALADSIAIREGVPRELVSAVIEVESGWNPKAYRAEPQIKDASYGLMQTLYGTARGLGYAGKPEGLFDPATSISLGAKYLKKMLDQFGGSWALALSAYNAGPGATSRAIKKAGSTDIQAVENYLPSITKMYWKKALTWARHYAGAIDRAEAAITAKAGVVTGEMLELSKSSAGKIVGLLVLALVVSLAIGGKHAG